MLKTLISRLAPQPQGKVEEESAQMKELRETHPALYAELQATKHKNTRLSAGLYETREALDRLEFLQTFGEEGKKYLPQIEQQLQEYRQRGLPYNRGQLYVHLRGIENIQRSSPSTQKVEAPAPQVVAPSSNPASAATLPPATAAGTGKLSTEEFESKFGDLEF